MTFPDSRLRLLALVMAMAYGGAATSAEAADPIRFRVQPLTIDANEGCAIADFDGDGQLDVSAGRNWYRNGDWLPRPVRTFDDVFGYVQSNGDFVWDVNGDGRPDIVAGSFFTTQVHWYENVGGDVLLQGMLWPKRLLVDTGLGSNEASFLHDLDGDGRPEWITNSWDPKNPVVAWKFDVREVKKSVTENGVAREDVNVEPTLVRRLLSEQGQGHGFGIGDVNNNGRSDIVTGAGWLECPEDPLEQPWTFHPDWNRPLSDPVLIRDLNGDGRSDIVFGVPHDYGLFVWWGEEPRYGKPQFREEQIDDRYSQLHCLHFADLDGDGRDEIITGKRVRAHNGGDPGASDPPIICYYKIDSQGRFDRVVINEGQVGIGLQIRTADLNGDGRVDIVVAGKEGTQILWNEGAAVP